MASIYFTPLFRNVPSTPAAENLIPLARISSFLESREKLSSYLDMEIIYDNIIEEYLTLRSKISYWTIKIATSKPDPNTNHEVRNSLNRTIFNILNISKLYLDKHYSKNGDLCLAFKITSLASSKEEVDTQRRKIHDSNLFYVIGCKLRNNSQHGKFPVSTFTSLVSRGRNDPKIIMTLDSYLTKPEIKKLNLPTARLGEIEKISLLDVITGYVSAITEMHALNRKLSSHAIDQLKESIRLLNQLVPDQYIASVVDDNNQTYHTDITWFSLADYLISKNHAPLNFNIIQA